MKAKKNQWENKHYILNSIQHLFLLKLVKTLEEAAGWALATLTDPLTIL